MCSRLTPALVCLPSRRLHHIAGCFCICATLQTAFLATAAFSQTAPAAQAIRATDAASDEAVPGSLKQMASQFDKTSDTVVADVNGSPIILGMIADRLRDYAPNMAALPASMVYRAALEDLVNQRAVAIRARELNLDKDPATQRRIQELTDHELAIAVINRLVPQMVTEKVIEQRYQSTIAGEPGPEEVQFRVIVSSSEAEAKQVLEALGKGTDFATVARASSRDPSSLVGGEIGYSRRDRLAPEIGAVAFALAPGQINAFPILSHGLWFVIRVESRRQIAAPSLDEAKPQLAAMLDQEASAEIIRRSRAAVSVSDFGPTGTRERALAITAH